MESAIKALTSLFARTPTALSLPGSPEYLSDIAIFWSTANQELKPQAIVKPKTTAELATVIKLLVEHKAKFAIRSGGGAPIPTSNNTTGILLALRDLNAVIGKPSDNVVSLGPGLRWGEVYRALDLEGRTVIGGRMTQVGVAGFLLGGGFSHLSHQHGMGCDNVVNYEVVLSSGEIVHANADENPDLFWALKGGGNNFGVVSRFDLRAIDQKNGIWGGMVVIGSDHIDHALEALSEWQIHDHPKDPKASALFVVIKGPGMGSKDSQFAMMMLCYGEPIENPEVLHRLTTIPSVHKTLRKTTHKELVEELSTSFDTTKRHIFHTGSFHADGKLNILAKDTFEASISETGLYEDESSHNTLTYQPVSASMLLQGEGKHAMDVNPSGAPYIWYVSGVQYSSKDNDEILHQAMERASTQLEAHAKKNEKHAGFLYLNDASRGQNPIRTYGERNINRMEKVRSQYDPDAVFTRLCSGGFKLS